MVSGKRGKTRELIIIENQNLFLSFLEGTEKGKYNVKEQSSFN